MKRVVVACMVVFFVVSAHADEIPLFAKVVGVSKGDSLNVRKEPHYRSKKVDALEPGSFVGVEQCKTLGHSRWCRVEELPNGGPSFHSGWVNARFLHADNRGYVIIENKPNCDFALACRGSKCKVVKELSLNAKDEVTSMQTEWVARKRLKPASRFSAMPADGDGYCISDHQILDYLNKKHSNSLIDSKDSAAKRVLAFTKALRVPYDTTHLANYIDPQDGIVMSWYLRFGEKEDKHFSQKEIYNSAPKHAKKLYWGTTYGKGDRVYLTLFDYLKTLTRDLGKISKVKRLSALKGFKRKKGAKYRAYEVLWINKASKSKEYDWLGLVVVLKKSEGQWNVVGVLRDRWTI